MWPRVTVFVEIEIGQDAAIVLGRSLLVVVLVVVLIVIVSVGQVDLEIDQEVLLLDDRDIDRCGERFVTDEDESVIPLQDPRDGLAQGVLVIDVLDVPSDPLDELEELIRLPFGLAHDEDVGVDVVVAFVEFVEEHGRQILVRWVGQYTGGGVMVRPAIQVVHIGSAARDIASGDPRGWRLGGGVTYAALTTAKLGLRTAALVGVDAEAASARELDLLRDAGVDLRLAELPESPVFHNLETSAGRVQTVVRTGVPLEPVALPASWTDAPGWSIAPVAGEIGDGWLASIPGSAIVAVGWQGLLRRLVAGERVERTPPIELGLLRRADLVGVSHHDVDATTKLSELARFLHPGARLLVTQGDRGGLLVTTGPAAGDDVLRYLPTRTDGEVDPTGAGDTFLAALLAVSIESGLVGSGDPAVAGGSRSDRLAAELRFAAAAGSLAVEGVGLTGVPSHAAVVARAARESVLHAVLPSLAVLVGSTDRDDGTRRG